HPWARVTGIRCLALVDLEGRASSEGIERLWAAADEYAELGLVFDRGRTLLALGRAARRHRRWGDARQALDAAIVTFESLGSDGWASVARDDLARIGGRRPAGATTLTPAERRAAELAIEGLANKEIAGRLGVSTATIERHLSRAYAKVGVASRTQLIRRLGDASGD
ncbi:MAG TPA: LuxR C-terminal-related transcriptional regulator, partial [Candidatus Limnocylindrales bacterium]